MPRTSSARMPTDDAVSPDADTDQAGPPPYVKSPGALARAGAALRLWITIPNAVRVRSRAQARPRRFGRSDDADGTIVPPDRREAYGRRTRSGRGGTSSA